VQTKNGRTRLLRFQAVVLFAEIVVREVHEAWGTAALRRLAGPQDVDAGA